MFLKFAKMNPNENMTILVLDPVPREHQAEVAEELMAYGSVHAEQVGFLEKPENPDADIRLQMMGGEFCGNASMAAGSYLRMQDSEAGAREVCYLLEVSGADGLVPCRVQRRRGPRDSCRVRMPLPQEVREMEFPGGIRCPVVFFPGIAHAILPEGELGAAEAEACIADWCRICGTDAFGIILCSESDLADCAICPLVYVGSTSSSVWERSCGSGTAALGAYTAWKRGAAARLDVEQPGGCIGVCAEYTGGKITNLEISGKVELACRGEAWVYCQW